MMLIGINDTSVILIGQQVQSWTSDKFEKEANENVATGSGQLARGGKIYWILAKVLTQYSLAEYVMMNKPV